MSEPAPEQPFANEPLLELRRAEVRERCSRAAPSSTRGCRCASRS